MIKEELNMVVVDLCFCGCFEWWVWFVFLFKFVPFWISWFSLGARELSDRSSRFAHFVYFRVSVNGSTLYVRFTVLKFGFHYSCYSLKPKYLRGVLWFSLHFNFFFLFSVRPWFGLRIGPKFGWAKRGPMGRVWAPRKKKTRLINRPGLGRGSWPADRVRVWKNLIRTRFVAIPIYILLYALEVILLFISNILLCCIVRNKLWLKIQMIVSFLYRSNFVKIVLGGVWFVFSNNYFSVFK